MARQSFRKVLLFGLETPAAMAACEVEPVDAMLVAVHPWDADGAHRAGLSAAWINRGGGRYPDYFLPADLEAASLLHLADRLR